MWDEGAFTQDMYRVVGAMRRIGEYETADLVSVREKERLFDETVERERRKWHAIADLWTATYFGLELTPELYNACVQYAQGKPVLLQAAQAEAVLAQAHEIWEQRRFFHWEIEFPEVFFDEYGRHKGDAAGFDAVVGNPPWGGELSEVEKGWLKTLYQAIDEIPGRRLNIIEGEINSYTIFLACASLLVREDGRVGFITPEGWLVNKTEHRFRDFLLNWVAFAEISVLRKNVFPDAPDVIPTIPIVARRRTDKTETVVNLYGFKRPVEELPGLKWQDTKMMSQSDWSHEPYYIFTVCQQSALIDRYRKMQSLSDRLSAGGEGHRMTYISDGIYKTHLMPLVSDQIGSHKVLLAASELERYCFDWQGVWISEAHYLTLPSSDQEKYLKPKLIFHAMKKPGVEYRVTCSYDPGGVSIESGNCGFVVSNNFVVLTPEKCSYSLHYLVAVCNSRLINVWYSDRYFQVNIEAFTLGAIPIRCISFTTSPQERERLVGVGIAEATEWIEATDISSAESVSFSAFSDSAFGRWLNERLSAVPEQSDVVHDLLAHRAGRMIELHKGKQAEVKGFLDWLATYTGLPVADWALKTNLQHYYEQDWAGMQRVLRSNQRRLSNVDMDVDRYKNAPAARLRAAWETSLETLRPLLARIAATDRLIDLIVYRLYELTEKEVTVVEGKG
jgi:hypothetical protein